MRQTPTAVLSTLRSRAKDLLPTTTVLLYGQDSTLLKKSLQSIKRQQGVTLECLLLADDPKYDPGDILPKNWPERFSLRLLKPSYPCGKSHLVNLALPYISGRHALVLQAGDRFEREEIAAMEQKRDQSASETAAVFGDLELWKSTWQGDCITQAIPGSPAESKRRFLARISRDHRLAPPLVSAKLLKKIGYPTDYPGEGYLLADTAFLLTLLGETTLEYHADLCIRRSVDAYIGPLHHQKEDERRILNVLLRQTAKQLGLPAP
jgi:glycosyltransferase involved in cell wall biosynthesis